MLKTRNGAVIGTGLAVASALVSAPAFAQSTQVTYADKFSTLVSDNAAILAILAGIVIAVAGYGLFRKLSHKA